MSGSGRRKQTVADGHIKKQYRCHRCPLVNGEPQIKGQHKCGVQLRGAVDTIPIAMVDTPMPSLHDSTLSITPPSPFVFYSPSSLHDGASSTSVDHGLLSPSLSLSPLPVPQGADFTPVYSNTIHTTDEPFPSHGTDTHDDDMDGSSVVPWDTFPFDVVYRQAVSEGELVIVMPSPTVGAAQALPSTETMQSLVQLVQNLDPSLIATGQSFTAPVITEKVHDVVAETEHVADAVTEMEPDETSIDVDTGPLFSDDDEPQNDDVDNEWMDEVQDAGDDDYIHDAERRTRTFSKRIQTILRKLRELDALCGAYIVCYIARPESITLKQGKTNYFITTNMLEILGDGFIRKLHGKIFAYAQSDLYNTRKALNANIKVQQARAAQVKAKEAQARAEKEKVAAEERKLAAEKEKAEAERERAVAEAGRDSALRRVEELQAQLAMFNSQQLSFGINSF